MSSLVYATGYIRDAVPLIKKRRGLSPGGRFYWEILISRGGGQDSHVLHALTKVICNMAKKDLLKG